MKKGWKSIVATFAPTVAAALGGPLAGTATKFLASQLLGDENASQSAIEASLLGASPSDLAKLKEIDNKFSIEMEQIGVDVFRLEIEDKQSARDLAKTNMWPHIILSALFVSGYFGILFFLFTEPLTMNQSQMSIVTVLMGVMTAAVANIMQFWFGSSSGSKEKTAKLKQR